VCLSAPSHPTLSRSCPNPHLSAHAHPRAPQLRASKRSLKALACQSRRPEVKLGLLSCGAEGPEECAPSTPPTHPSALPPRAKRRVVKAPHPCLSPSPPCTRLAVWDSSVRAGGYGGRALEAVHPRAKHVNVGSPPVCILSTAHPACIHTCGRGPTPVQAGGLNTVVRPHDGHVSSADV
jgi:hypothetical protein